MTIHDRHIGITGLLSTLLRVLQAKRKSWFYIVVGKRLTKNSFSVCVRRCGLVGKAPV